MTTPRDLMIVAVDAGEGPAGRPVDSGDVSLALAAAEVVDLLAAEAVRLAEDLIVPGGEAGGRPVDDPQLNEALAVVVRDEPFETVGDWLWRRGRGLAGRYLAVLEAEGEIVRPRSRWRSLALRPTRPEPADTPSTRAALERRSSGEPLLSALVEAAGIGDERTGAAGRVPGGDGATVLAALEDVLTELKFQRHRRALDQAAFDNVWRGE